MNVQNCPACGAPATVEMLKAGECGYCHAALVKPGTASVDAELLAKELNKLRPVVKYEIKAPTVDLETTERVVDSVTGRVFGCFSGTR